MSVISKIVQGALPGIVFAAAAGIFVFYNPEYAWLMNFSGFMIALGIGLAVSGKYGTVEKEEAGN
jgi:hypothetical protein